MIFGLVQRIIVPVESSWEVHRQQEPEEIEAPKRHVRHRERSSDQQPPHRPAELFVFLRELVPQPLRYGEDPPRVVEHRYEHADRRRESVVVCHAFHENLGENNHKRLIS